MTVFNVTSRRDRNALIAEIDAGGDDLVAGARTSGEPPMHTLDLDATHVLASESRTNTSKGRTLDGRGVAHGLFVLSGNVTVSDLQNAATIGGAGRSGPIGGKPGGAAGTGDRGPVGRRTGGGPSARVGLSPGVAGGVPRNAGNGTDDIAFDPYDTWPRPGFAGPWDFRGLVGLPELAVGQAEYPFLEKFEAGIEPAGQPSTVLVSAGQEGDFVTLLGIVDGVAGAILIQSNQNATFAPGDNQTLTVTTVIADQSGPTSLIINAGTNGGTVILNADNTYTGATVINSGTVIAGIAGAIGGGDLTVAAGAVLNLNNFAQSVGDLSGGGAVVLGTATLTATGTDGSVFGGVISGTGKFIKQGAGTLTLTGTSTFANGTVSAGTLRLGDGGAVTGALKINTGAVLEFNQTGSVTLSGAVTGTGTLVQSGTGTLTVANAEPLSAATVTAGTLLLGAGGSLPNNSALEVDGGIFDVNGKNQTIGALSGTGGTIDLGGGTLTTASNAVGTLATVMTGPGALVVNGTPRLTLTAAETFGSATINGGTLTLGSGGSLASTTALTINGGRFALTGQSQTIGDLAGSAGTIVLAGGTLTAGTANSTTLAATLSGSGVLIKQGAGTLTLSGAETFTGATVTSGTLRLLSTSNIPSSAVAVNGGTLAIAGGNPTIGDLSGTGGAITLTGALIVGTANSTTVAAKISGTAGLIKQGSGTLTLAAQNDFTGAIAINDGAVEIADKTSASHGPIQLNGSDATLRIDGSIMPANTIQGFSPGNTINLAGVFAASATIDTNNLLTVTPVGGGSVTIRLGAADSFSGLTARVAGDGHGGSEITLATVGQTYTVASLSALNTATLAMDSGGKDADNPNEAYTIKLTGDITLTKELPAINLLPNSSVTIVGNNHTIDGGGAFRGLFVFNGSVAIQDLTIQDTMALGGAGGTGLVGGGGGAGLGGGLFVAGTNIINGATYAGGDVTLNHVTFLNNNATGGAGGKVVSGFGGGGGGGLGGAGGASGANQQTGGGGGGVGLGADGAITQFSSLDSGADGNDGGLGIISSAAAAGKGANSPDNYTGTHGVYTFRYGGAGGLAGGGGGSGATLSGSGGGGVGGQDSALRESSGGDFKSGAGGFGGGGGGGVNHHAGGQDFRGSPGGFGGGGGGGLSSPGQGGFGGGGSGAYSTDGGAGGFGAGDGGGRQYLYSPLGFFFFKSHHGGGGGGLGAGGDIFVQQGGKLTIGTGSLSGASVAGGAGGGDGATDGGAFGAGIFLQGDNGQRQAVNFAPPAGSILRIADAISDQQNGAGALMMSGAGTLSLQAGNKFTGGSTILAGIVQLGTGGSLAASGAVEIDGGLFDLGGHTQTIGDLFGIGGTIDLNSGTLTAGAAKSTTLNAKITGSGRLIKQGAGTLTLTGPVSIPGATVAAGTLLLGPGEAFGVNTLAMTGGTFDVGGLALNITDLSGTGGAILLHGGTITTGSTNTTTLTASITGPGVLVRNGTGTLILAGGNAFTSGTITAGTLGLGKGATFDPPTALLIAGGTFALNGLNETLGDLSGGGGAITLGGGTLTEGTANSTILGAVISGTGTLIKQGAGTLTLAAAETFTGATIAAGTMLLGTGGSLLSTSAMVVNGGTFALNGRTQTLGDLSGTSGEVALGGGTLTAGTTNSATLAASVSGTGVLVKQGSGTLTLTGSNSFASGTIAAGTLRLGNGGSTGAISGALSLAATAVLAVNESGTVILGGTISGGGILTQVGKGVLRLTGAQKFTSETITAGTLLLDTGGDLLPTSRLVVNGGTVSVNGHSVTVADLAGTSGVIALSGGVLTAGANNSTTLATAISGTGTLVKQGTGTLTLTHAESFTSGTVLAGTLLLGTGGSLLSSAELAINGGTFALNGHAQTIGDLSGTGGAITLGAGTLTAGTANSTTLAAAVTGAGVLVKQGAGTLTLTGTETVTNTTISGGTMLLGAGGGLPSTGTLAVNGGTFALGGHDQTIGALSGSGGAIALDGGTLTAGGGTPTVLGAAISGVGAFVKQGSGLLSLTGANTFNSGTVTAGTLRIGNGGTSGGVTGAISLAAGATLASFETGTVVLPGVLSGGGGVEQTGSGTTKLAVANSYAGGTTINAGTVEIAAGANAGTGSVVFGGAGATLKLDGGILPGNTIAGLRSGTTIDLAGIAASSATIGAGNVLSVFKAGGGTVTLPLAVTDDFTGQTLTVAPDGMGGTDLTMTIGYTVATESALNVALLAIENGGRFGFAGAAATIDLTANITLDTDLVVINLHDGASVALIGHGHTIDGADTYRGLFALNGTVVVNDLTIQNAVARGGAGGSGAEGGGGGAGLGGGLFVAGPNNVNSGTYAGADVTLNGVTFLRDWAIGGAGGTVNANYGAGGGGGLGGNGGAGLTSGGGGGGIGHDAAGGAGNGSAGGPGIVGGATAAGAGYLGGAGGGGGGGGGGGQAGASTMGGGGGVGGVTSQGQYPGFGQFGGGGGGGFGTLLSGQPGLGASGFFGGGGGGGAIPGSSYFGGGGGGSYAVPGGYPNFGGGRGGGSARNKYGVYVPAHGGGGGGLGAGGAIFVQQGGKLTIGAGGLSSGGVAGGAGGGGGATAGSALGSGIFLQGGGGIQTVTLAPPAGQILTIADAIAAQIPAVGGIVVSGQGTLVLGAANTFSGGTTIQTGTLEIGGGGASGGPISFTTAEGTLRIDGATLPSNTIKGFGRGQTIDLAGIAYAPGDLPDYSSASGMLFIKDAASNIVAQLSVGSNSDLASNPFVVRQETSGTGIVITNVACFGPETLIETERGDVPVEALAIGDRVMTASGVYRSIRWLGHRRLDLVRHPAPHRVQPIRVRPDAFGAGMPRRDLWLSPDHALPVGDILIPIRLLVNGGSIVRETAWRAITYHHVELASHDILLAENLAVESYLDTGNRGMFENAPGVAILHPDLADDQARREAGSCLPFASDAARVEPAWRALAERAARLGWRTRAGPASTDDPALELCVGGRRVKPLGVASGHYTFALAGRAKEMRLLSRAATPSEARPWISDDRHLGVLVRGLTFYSGALASPIPLDHPSLGAGWWQPEWHGPASLRRWTNGDALLRTPEAHLAAPGCLLKVEVAATMAYPLTAPGDASGVVRAV